MFISIVQITSFINIFYLYINIYIYILHVSILLTVINVPFNWLSNLTFYIYCRTYNHIYRVLMYLDHHLVLIAGARGFYHRLEIKYTLELIKKKLLVTRRIKK